KLRSNQIINYQQLGLAFRLYACEVLFNRGICRLYLGKIDAGLTDLYHAQKSKMTEEHDVIDQAVRDRGKGYSVFSIPVGVLYRPPESRLRQVHGNIDMFAAVDKLGLMKQQKPIMATATAVTATAAANKVTRNNSVLLTTSKFQRKQSLGFPTSSPLSKSLSSTTSSQQPTAVPMRFSSSQQGTSSSPPMPDPYPVASHSSHYPRQQNNIPSLSSSPQQRQPLQTSTSLPYLQQHHQQQQYSDNNNNSNNNNTNNQYYTSNEDWNDSSSFTSSLRYRSDGRRVDSGFESSHEDRFSTSSSRNSAKSHKTTRYSPPPVPPIPKNSASVYDDIFDPMSYSQFDDHSPQQQQQHPYYYHHQQLANNMQQMSLEEERDRIRGRLSSNNMIEDDMNGPRRGSEQSGKSTRSSASANTILNNNQQRMTPQPSTSTSTTHSRDMLQQQSNKIKIKVHHIDTRVLLVPNTITFEELITRVKEKLNAPANTRLQYKDEDNEMVLMIDDDDLQMARQIHRIRNNQDIGVEKMEIWCIT
ncbi:hypothetical protein BJ944DRAFT_273974, partial [Cunninghamella echinulata]